MIPADSRERFYSKSQVDQLVANGSSKVIQRCSFIVFLAVTALGVAILLSQHHSFSAAYAYITHEGVLYAQIYGIAAGTAFITFVISSCHQSQKIKKFRDFVINKNGMYLDKFRHLFFKSGFFYGKSIDDFRNNPSWFKKHIVSRIAVLGISIFSAIQLAQDIQHVICHSINGTVSCLTRCESPLRYPSNYRNVALVVGEIFTHILGTCFGTIIGIFVPEIARKWFLPIDQTAMEHRPENMTQEEAGTLYGMLKIVDDLFIKHKLKYAIIDGTVLGKERHGGIIPWDDDIDLFLTEGDEDKLLQLNERWASYDLAIIPCRIGYKIYYTKGRAVHEGDLEYKYPFIDVAIAQEKDGTITYRDEHSRQLYAGSYYTREEWNSVGRISLGPIEVNGLSDGSEFVTRCYGEASMDYGFTFLNHRTFGIEFPRKYFLYKNNPNNPKQCKPIEYDEAAFNRFLRDKEEEVSEG